MGVRFDWCARRQHVICRARYEHEIADPARKGATYTIKRECGCTCHERPDNLNTHTKEN